MEEECKGEVSKAAWRSDESDCSQEKQGAVATGEDEDELEELVRYELPSK